MAATILIADDDAVQRRLVENMVQKCGYEPLVVDSGDAAVALLTAPDAQTIDASATASRQKTLGQAVWQITLADVSMSLDNVLAVAGAAREHPMILIFGLALSIALMGLAASFIARLLEKHRWIAYVGLAIILYVAFDMCYRGALEVWPHLNV